MAFVIKALGSGNAGTSSTTYDLYTVPANKWAIVSSVRVVNNHSTTVSPTTNLYVKPSGATARRIYKRDTTIATNSMIIVEEVVTLGQGDKIQLEVVPSATPNLDYLVSGVERD